MPIPPRPPSRIDMVTFPIFGMSWWADPGTGLSLVAYCGGGGSAKTGVFNNLVLTRIADDDDVEPPQYINTGERVGLAITMYQNPAPSVAQQQRQAPSDGANDNNNNNNTSNNNPVWLVVALGDQVARYNCLGTAASDGQAVLDGVIEMPEKESANAVAVNAMGDCLAVGCDSGLVLIYEISETQFRKPGAPLFACEGHTKTVCGLSFSLRGGSLLSSAKDGTARVWHGDQAVAVMQCTVEEPPPPKGKKARPQRGAGQVLVRGCAFGDMDGNVFYTVASPRRGKSFLSKWVLAYLPDVPPERQQQDGPQWQLAEKTEINPNPVSAMSISQDGMLLTLGGADGNVVLFDTEQWKPIKVFKEVHDLPVTCIAARPYYTLPLQGEEDGVKIHARSASADSRMGCLTTQRRVPRQRKTRGGPGSGGTNQSSGLCAVMSFFHRLFSLAFISLLLYPLLLEARDKCGNRDKSISDFGVCILKEVIIAPPTRPGISVPPY